MTDKVREETVEAECIDLYLKPMFAFTYTWAAKNKTAEIAMDGVCLRALHVGLDRRFLGIAEPEFLLVRHGSRGTRRAIDGRRG